MNYTKVMVTKKCKNDQFTLNKGTPAAQLLFKRKTTVFCYVAPCNLVARYQRLKGVTFLRNIS
jgi:hypothetical protein